MSRFYKSEKYKGVYQQKNGKWGYRFKKKVNGEYIYCERFMFDSEREAYNARQLAIKLEAMDGNSNLSDGETILLFKNIFSEFLESCESEASRKKYRALYTAQLKIWNDRDIRTITNSDVETLLLKLSLLKKSESYQASFRKVIKLFFAFAHRKYGTSSEVGQFQNVATPKLKVLSLFSGIGAPEQALRNLNIDYELVNFCEIDDNAAYAYRLMHKIDDDKDWNDEELFDKWIIDILDVDFEYCNNYISDFDLMIFGFPCQDISRQGNQKGIVETDAKHPSISSLWSLHNFEKFTRSGLFYKALQIALWKRPKFMIAENVSALVSSKFKNDFNLMLWNLQDAGYSIYFQELDSKDYGVPQHRDRVFMVMVRSDVGMYFEFPKPDEPKEVKKDWIQEWLDKGTVADEYYVDMSKDTKYVEMLKGDYDFEHSKGYIRCITTKQGSPTHNRVTYIKDERGIRCLTSEELFAFQGFRKEQATLLRNAGYTKDDVAKLAGNSITVQVIQKIFEQFIDCLAKPISVGITPKQTLKAKSTVDFIAPLFPYMGNKSQLLPSLVYLFPQNRDDMVFVDLFAGAATVAINAHCERIILNEIDPLLMNVYKALAKIPPDEAWEMVMGVVDRYDLSAENQEEFYQCRADYNKIPVEERYKEYWYWGLALVYFSFDSNNIRYTQSGFMPSFGKDNCNIDNFKRRFFPFAKKLYNNSNYEFFNQSYKDFKLQGLRMDEFAFYYVDPPYLITTATYNVNWHEKEERELYSYLDNLDRQGEKWMLSNVIWRTEVTEDSNGEQKTKTIRNQILFDWLQRNVGKYRVYFMNRDYSNASYNKKESSDTEIAVINYVPESEII